VPKTTRLPIPEDYDRLLGTEKRPELLVIRGHQLIERELVELIAIRLGVEFAEVPERLSFELSTRVAFAGARYDADRQLLLRFNTVRNKLSHDPEYSHVQIDIVAIARELFGRYPEWYLNNPDTNKTTVAALVAVVFAAKVDVLQRSFERDVAHLKTLERCLDILGQVKTALLDPMSAE
jgi:hypothetical protein